MSAKILIESDYVTLDSFVINNSDFVEYLSDCHEDDHEDAIVELIKIALDVRSAFSTNLETKNITDAAELVVNEINETYEKFVKDFEESLLAFVDSEDSPAIRAFKEATGSNLARLLAPDGEDAQPGPIARLRKLIAADLSGELNKLDESLDAIKTKLRVGKDKRKTSFDGVDFEAKIDKVIQEFARTYGDTAESTGAIAENGGGKKGDTKVTLNVDDTLGKTCTLLWEAKTDKVFKNKAEKVVDSQVKNELNSIIELRSADAAILVLDSEGINTDEQPLWREYEGNKLLIIVDTFNPDPDLIRLAYLWGRWKSRSSIVSLEAKIDVDGIRGSFDEMNQRLKDLRNVKRHHTIAIEGITTAGALLSSFRKDLKGMIEELALQINIDIKIETVEDEEE